MPFNKGFFKEHDEVWVERYRPKTFKDLICEEGLKEKLMSFVKNQDVSNLLLEGPAGTGKSSIANLLVREIDCDFKEINASNERGIETVRDVVQNFCMTAGFSRLKIMVFSEFSEFTPIAQGAMRDIMEKYSAHTRFIMTCNSVERIIEPIRSRCSEYTVIPPSKKQVLQRCEYILKSEDVTYDAHELQTIVDFSYPDVRKSIQSLEQQTIDGVLKLNKEFFKLLRYQEKIVEIAKTVNSSNIVEKVTEIRQLVADARVKNYTQLFRYLYEKIDDYCPKKKVLPVIFALREGVKDDPLVADKEINLVATVLKVFEEIAS